MDVRTVVSEGWQRHADSPAEVWATCQAAAAAVEDPGDAAALVALAAHVGGEHLGRWADVLGLLEGLRARPRDPATDRMLWRRIAVAHVVLGHDDEAREAERRSVDEQPLRAAGLIRAAAASALVAQGNYEPAMGLLLAASAAASYGPAKDDPLAGSLATNSNNIAATLEERTDRGDAGTQLMVIAAELARRWWEVAGDWTNVERAEYRLARSLIEAGRGADAVGHADACLSICEANGAADDETFWAHEVSARARWAAGDVDGAYVAVEYADACARRVPDESGRATLLGEVGKLRALVRS